MHKLADIRGGVSVAASELGGNFLPEGAVLTAPDDNGICHVVKLAKLTANASASETHITIDKTHNFAKGDIVAAKVGGTATTITAIDTTSKGYDTITLAETLGKLNKGAYIFEAASVGSSASLKHTPKAINGTGKAFNTDSNINTDAWLFAVTKGHELPSAIAEALPGIINY